MQRASSTHQSYDCIIIDADDYKNVDDHDDVPMFVQHTEAMLEEIDRMVLHFYVDLCMGISNPSDAVLDIVN